MQVKEPQRTIEQDMRIRAILFYGSTVHSFDGEQLAIGQKVTVNFKANADFVFIFDRGDQVEILDFPEPGSGWVRVKGEKGEQTLYASDLVVHYQAKGKRR